MNEQFNGEKKRRVYMNVYVFRSNDELSEWMKRKDCIRSSL